MHRSISRAIMKAARAYDDASVTTPKGFKQAYGQYREGGWMGLSVPRSSAARVCPIPAIRLSASISHLPTWR